MLLSQRMKRLVLFDIDGTLLNGGTLWRECFEAGFRGVFPSCPFPRVAFSGKTDRQICAEVLAKTGSSGQTVIEDVIDRMIAGYIGQLKAALAAGRAASHVELLPGVHELLKALMGRTEVTIGLLTGNVRDGARLKLASVGIDHYFAPSFNIGAFGDDHSDRYRLPEIAVARARAELGLQFQGKEVVIIGDTVHDVNCGRSIGVRAIAVGTGRPEYRDEILRAGPDSFFETLVKTNEVLTAILE